MNDPMSTWLGKYGLVDNITLDYFDIDTDPSGSFQAGQPYRSLGPKYTRVKIIDRKTGASCPPVGELHPCCASEESRLVPLPVTTTSWCSTCRA